MDHILQRWEAAIVHVWSGLTNVAQRWSPELAVIPFTSCQGLKATIGIMLLEAGAVHAAVAKVVVGVALRAVRTARIHEEIHAAYLCLAQCGCVASNVLIVRAIARNERALER